MFSIWEFSFVLIEVAVPDGRGKLLPQETFTAVMAL